MKEARDRCAEQEMETADFVRFVEYAYRGDFTAPSPIFEPVNVKLEEEHGVADQLPPGVEAPAPSEVHSWSEAVPDIAEETAAQVAEEDGGWGAFVAKKKKGKSKTSLFRKQIFDSHDYSGEGDFRTSITGGFTPGSNSAPELNFTPVFLAYARLYGFSEMRLIHELKALTLHKLHCTLKNFTLFPARISDVIELVRCAYENTPNRRADGSVDELRALVVEYLVCKHQKIGKSIEFKGLLEEGGEFVSDFWDVLSKHII